MVGDQIPPSSQPDLRGTPVPFAIVGVTSSGVAAGTTTGVDGRYSIQLRAGDYTVQVSKATFESTAKTIHIAADTTADFEVTKQLLKGRIDDLQLAADVITGNQAVVSSYRRADLISRWELPVPVYLDAHVDRSWAIEALDYYATNCGISYEIISTDTLPRILIRFGTDGLGSAVARGLIDGTYSNNRPKSGLVVIKPFDPNATIGCNGDLSSIYCKGLLQHEIGHALGFQGAVNSLRFNEFFRLLYSLPHGTRVEYDGTWQVIVQ